MNKLVTGLTLNILITSLLCETPKGRSFSQSGCQPDFQIDPKLLQNLPSQCFISTKVGDCRGSFDSYHFDPKTKECIQAVFGGCDSGCLAYRTKEACESSCKPNSSKPDEDSQSNKPCHKGTKQGDNSNPKDKDESNLNPSKPNNVHPVDPNSKAITPSRSFIQEGCQEIKPRNKTSTTQSLPSKCYIKTETGMCRSMINSYHFNAETGECEKSVFGGCNDGCLAFETKEECLKVCKK